MNAAATKPIIYPAVGPVRATGPFLNPLKTGNPIKPISIYISCPVSAHLLPRKRPEISTVNTWVVTGTGVKGRYIKEFADMAMSKAKTKENNNPEPVVSVLLIIYG